MLVLNIPFLLLLYLMCILLSYLHNCSGQYCICYKKSYASKEAEVHMGLLLYVYTAKNFSELFLIQFH